jgi:CheY-like chemotaxis protein
MNPEPKSVPCDAQLRVLVAEDGLVNRHLAERLLQDEGFDVTTAENGQLAVAELDQRRFDLVLMDVDMPVMDGLTATREIRERERARGTRTRIVALTSNPNREQCLAAGMDAFLAKPLRLGALRELLGDVLDGSAA